MTRHQILHVTVPGIARPQGSKRHVGGGRMIEASNYVAAWRAKVANHMIAAIIRDERQRGTRWPLTGPVHLQVAFYLPRPQNHYRAGKFAGMLRNVAPVEMQTGPDLDKLVRAIGDAMTAACVVVDDKQIHRINAVKAWAAPGDDPFTAITIGGTTKQETK